MEPNYRDLDDFENFSESIPRENFEYLKLKSLTKLKYDGEEFKVALNSQTRKLQVIRERDQKLMNQTTVKLVTKLDQCLPLHDSKFICSTGSLL